MTTLYLGIAIFFSAHLFSAFRSRETNKDVKITLGSAKYMALYSLFSLMGLLLIIWGYSKAEVTPLLFLGIDGARPAIPLLMALAMILLVSAYVPQNHIKAGCKHPMLLAIALWAMAHLLDGGNLKQVILFGSFLGYSAIDILAVSARKENQDKTMASPKLKYDLLTLVLATLLYTVMIAWLHTWLFGLKPMS